MRIWEGYQHGINLTELFTVNHDQTISSTLTEADFEKFKAWDLDHIRISIPSSVLESAGGIMKEEHLALLDDVLQNCNKHNINVILNIYGFIPTEENLKEEENLFENLALQAHFYSFWRYIAKAFAKYSNFLTLEVCSQAVPTQYLNPWRNILKNLLSVIRPCAPVIQILVAAIPTDSSLSFFGRISEDKRMIYSFSFFEPEFFTQQCNNTDFSRTNEYHFIMLTDNYLKEPIRSAVLHNIPLYCRAYGVKNQANPQLIVRWYEWFKKYCKDKSIGCCAMSYDTPDYSILIPALSPELESLTKLL